MGAENTVHICMISDDNYVMPTCVAITSFVRAKNPHSRYVIHILASALTEQSQQKFAELATPSVEIDILTVDPDRFAGLHQFDENAICVASISALFKFLLPELFPDLEKVLYLDGDLIARCDLSEVYNIHLGNHLVAAVRDSGGLYWQHEYMKRVKAYFNSGVMLLNLARMRRENLSEKLIETKRAQKDSMLMDQNVFNVVMDGSVLELPIRYNFMPVSLYRAYDKWNADKVNALYGTEYKTKKDLVTDAAIVHYSSKDKPWKDPDGACADWWLEAYLAAPVSHDLVCLPEVYEPYGISVIMPCYNVEGYVKQTLESLYAQTYQNIEILCLDDGSTDGTLELLNREAQLHPCVKVFANQNHRQGWERNFGVQQAQGKYIYYMDSDDLLSPECLERLFVCAQLNRLDLILFEGDSFYESEDLRTQFSQYETAYSRKHFYPVVYSGRELFLHLQKKDGFMASPCLQMARRTYLLENEIVFPELPCMEDNLYSLRAILCADRAKILAEAYFHRRVRANSTMTAEDKNLNALRAFIYTTAQVMRMADNCGGDEELQKELRRRGALFARRVKEEMEKAADRPEDIEKAINENAAASELMPALLFYINETRTLEGRCKWYQNQIKALRAQKTPKGKIARKKFWLELKIRGGIQCVKDNGWKYTIRHFFEKVARKLGLQKKD